MPSYRAKPIVKKPAKGAKPKVPMHRMPDGGMMAGAKHPMADKEMASHMGTKAIPPKPRKTAKRGK